MRNRKTNLIIFILAAIACISSACRPNLQSSLTGKWKSAEPGSVDGWRFAANNKFEKLSALGFALTGTYKIEDGQTVTLNFDASDTSAKTPAPLKVKIAVASDKMTLDDGQRVYNYVRDFSADASNRTAAASPELKRPEVIADGSAKSAQIDPKIEFDVESLQTGKPKLVGTTNLPEGTNLMVTIDGNSAEYAGRGKTQVIKGKFQSSEFSNEGKPLAKSSYFVEVIMPIAEAQPESVQQIIGKEGENLKGALVQKSSVGTTVKFRKEFSIK